MRRRSAVLAAAAAYVLGLAAVLLLPVGRGLADLCVFLFVLWNYRLGWPGQPTPDTFGFVLNIVLFVPVGILLVLLLRWPWWRSTLAAVAVSVGVELVQVLPVLHRQSSAADVLANGLGGLVGSLTVLAHRRLHRGRPRPPLR